MTIINQLFDNLIGTQFLFFLNDLPNDYEKNNNQPTLDLTHCEFWNERIKEKKRKEFLQRCWVNEEYITFTN